MWRRWSRLKTSPSKARRAALFGALVAIGVPALGQDKPESLLPPGFDEPAAPRAAPAQPVPAAAPAAPAPAAPAGGAAASPDAPLDGNLSGAVFGSAQGTSPDLSRYELPEFARHSLSRVGIVAGGNTPFAATAFGNSDGRWLRTLMRRLDAPIASRWVSIALRRALMSAVDTPANLNGADFAAERAWLLLRMGEANAARAVIAYVDVEDYSPWLYQVAMQSAMASADPAALCPVADAAVAQTGNRNWALARAVCAGLAGKAQAAQALFDDARRGTPASAIDNQLAQRALGLGAQGRRSATIDWVGVTELTSWRWGMATAMGIDVPDALYDVAAPQVRYWQAVAPALAPAARVAAAESAAAAGVFSNAGLVDLYGEIDQEGGARDAVADTVRDLRTAHAAADTGARLKAIQRLWFAVDDPRTRYARLVLTARAASWIPADPKVESPELLIASMLSAGYDAAAMEWHGVVKPGTEAWALLTLAEPGPMRKVQASDLSLLASAAGQRKAQIVLAGLAGLGRLGVDDARQQAEALGVQLGAANHWTDAIDAAGMRGDAGTVALLAGVGMQARRWSSITPEALFHIVAAMRAAGMGTYARMVAVEALTRA